MLVPLYVDASMYSYFFTIVIVFFEVLISLLLHFLLRLLAIEIVTIDHSIELVLLAHIFAHQVLHLLKVIVSIDKVV